MKRALFLALAATAALAAPAASRPVDSGFAQNSLSTGNTFAIRSCQKQLNGPFSYLCYNQATQINVAKLGPVPLTPFTVTKERSVRVNCLNIPRSDKSTRGQLAAEFCPQVRKGTLAPAPFLTIK